MAFSKITAMSYRFLSSCWVLLVVAVLDVGCQDVGRPYDTPDSCLATSYFSPVTLDCMTCPANQTASNNGLSCRCSQGFYKVAGSGVDNFICKRCPAGQVVSRDGLFCLECSGGTNFEPATNQCSRCSLLTQIYADTLPVSQNAVGSRSCTTCPQGTWSSSDGFSCVECGLTDCTTCVS